MSWNRDSKVNIVEYENNKVKTHIWHQTIEHNKYNGIWL